MLDNSARGRNNRHETIAYEDICIAPRASHRALNDAVQPEHVHRALHEARDHCQIEFSGTANLRREGRNAHLEQRVREKPRIAGVSKIWEIGKSSAIALISAA